MNKIVNFLFLCFCVIFNYGICIASTMNDEVYDLQKVSEWITDNVCFPEDAYKYRVAGIEQFCISTSWDGKVFISSGLSTLNPAFEEEIKKVVEGAPKCNIQPKNMEGAYQYITVDFYELIPLDKRDGIKRYPLHVPPRFAVDEQRNSPFNGRDNFMRWVYDKLKIPAELGKGYSDTVSIKYTVNEKGRIRDVLVEAKSQLLSSEILNILNKSPRWTPAYTVDKQNISVVFSDKLIVGTECDNGDKSLYTQFVENVFSNTSSSPSDSDVIVYNPEVKPVFIGDHTFLWELSSPFRKILSQKGINVDYSVSGSLIIGADGIPVDIEFDILPDFSSEGLNTDSILRNTINGMRWIAAKQGGVPVRTEYTFGFNGHKKTRHFYMEPYYKAFGKYYIYFIADPVRRNYGFVGRDGSLHYFPFNRFGLFDYDAYYKGVFYYNKINGKGSSSDKYMKNIYPKYVK